LPVGLFGVGVSLFLEHREVRGTVDGAELWKLGQYP
jgi:hypothetical protein